MNRRLRQWFRDWASRGQAAVLLLLIAGCQNPPACDSGCDEEEAEPNGTFARAGRVRLAADDSAFLAGAISVAGDIDVFDLGAAQAGDVVRAVARRQSGRLRASLALYDDEGELIDEDTLSSLRSFGASPTIEHVVREETARVFLAISHSFVGASTGDYEINVSLERGGPPPPTSAQIVLLSFSGGEFTDPLFGVIEVGPFDAANIGPTYAGQTQVIKDALWQTILQNYERFDIVLLDADDPAAPADGDFSRVLFGGFNGLAFGAADDVDPYNRNLTDEAIVFTDAFTPDLFDGAPSAASLGEAIGNVAAHELGHLLGLHHVNDAVALMDESSPAVTLLEDQEFMRAPLSASIFPLGHQDAGDLLRVILGPNPEAAKMGSAGAQTWPSPDSPFEERKTFSASPGFIDAGPGARTLPGKCLNCMIREGQAGHGPLRDLLQRRAADK